MEFKDLNIIDPILEAIYEKGYNTPTEIQKEAITPILEGKDLLGCAQTGTGKTAAFAIPILQMLQGKRSETTGEKKIKALILTPTRELALQIRDSFRTYGNRTNLSCSVIFGGVNQHSQITVLKKGVDILVATPGRLLDLINQRYARLGSVEYLVLDEADTMLDMGFIHDVKKIVSNIPDKRQTLLFSATMPAEISKLADSFLKNPTKIIVTPVASTVDKINQAVYYVDKRNKSLLLLDLLKKEAITSALVFTRTKHGANKLVQILQDNKINCAAIHGNKSQSARQLALSDFKSGKTTVLVATDIAARGIDIRDLPYVINFEMPNVAETYVHRIGRTGRAGLTGTAISLCDIDEMKDLRIIEKLTRKEIPVITDHPYPMLITDETPKAAKPNRSGNKRNFSNGRKPTSINKEGTFRSEERSKPSFNRGNSRSDSRSGSSFNKSTTRNDSRPNSSFNKGTTGNDSKPGSTLNNSTSRNESRPSSSFNKGNSRGPKKYGSTFNKTSNNNSKYRKH